MSETKRTTLIIPDVDVGLLQLQTATLVEILFNPIKPNTPEEIDALQGIVNLLEYALDADSNREEINEDNG